MINLLSDDNKSRLSAARSNVFIVRYMLIIMLATLFIAAALYTSYSVLTLTMNSSQETLEANDIRASVYKDTKDEVDALSAKLSEAKAILDQEIRYSEVLLKMGQIMPANTVMGELKLSSVNFTGTPLEVKVYAKSTDETNQIQSAFQNSPMFSKVEIKGTETSGGIDDYPVSVTLSLTLNRAGL